MTASTQVPTTQARDTFASYAAHQGRDLARRFRLGGAGGVEVAAHNARVELDDGRSVLDLGSYAVPLLGHRHPAVVARTIDELDAAPTSTRLIANRTVGTYLERLNAALGEPRLQRVWLGLNGADAVEAALKLAVAVTGVPSVLAVERGYHGKSTLALAATWDPARKRQLGGLLPDSRHIPLAPDAVGRALDERPAAALIVEPVQGEGGGRQLPRELLHRWCTDAHERGCLVIADEIQCGFYRCGELSQAIALDLDVDAVLLGKALGGGVMPLSALVANDRLWSPIESDPYFHTATFAAHPLACAAGLGALDAVEASRPDLDQASAMLRRLVDSGATAGGDAVIRAQSFGLFGVLELATTELATSLMLRCARAGLLLAPSLTWPQALRALPSCTLSSADWSLATDILVESLNAINCDSRQPS